jgi:phospholipid transport system substrate-binding protein
MVRNMIDRGKGLLGSRARLAVLCAALALAAAPAGAQPAPTPAAKVVDSLHAELLAVMKNAAALGFQGRYQRLEPALRRSFDLSFMAEKAVGRHWRELSPDDQARMRDVFARFTLSTYANRFDGYTGERFETQSEQPAPRDTVFVRTRLVRPSAKESIEINYRLHRTDDGWRIIDVLLRGTVSELALRRSEYSAVIQRDGFAALISTLERKIADLAAGKVEDTES